MLGCASLPSKGQQCTLENSCTLSVRLKEHSKNNIMTHTTAYTKISLRLNCQILEIDSKCITYNQSRKTFERQTQKRSRNIK